MYMEWKSFDGENLILCGVSNNPAVKFFTSLLDCLIEHFNGFLLCKTTTSIKLKHLIKFP